MAVLNIVDIPIHQLVHVLLVPSAAALLIGVQVVHHVVAAAGAPGGAASRGGPAAQRRPAEPSAQQLPSAGPTAKSRRAGQSAPEGQKGSADAAHFCSINCHVPPGLGQAQSRKKVATFGPSSSGLRSVNVLLVASGAFSYDAKRRLGL